jgi:crotonobetainyl-CoA:carnitine CoA-transferase CaiB-like acyl-CoA transferase
LFAYLNASKRSVSLNLESATGRELVRELARRSHVVVESFAPHYLDSISLGPSSLLELQPGLVITSVPPFERGNRYANFEMQELNLYAMSGLMSLVGGRDKPPIKAGGYQANYMSGLHAASLTLFAAGMARRTGKGAWIETSSMESCAKIFTHMVDYTLAGSEKDAPSNRRERQSSVVRCKDGYMTVTLYYFQTQELGDLLGKPELSSDRRFESEEALRDHGKVLKSEVEQWLTQRTGDEAQSAGQSRHLLFTKVNSTRDLYQSEHLKARRFFLEVQHPEIGSFGYPGAPFRLSRTAAPPPRPSPRLGEANEEVFGGLLGIDAKRLAALQEEGVV